MKRLVSVLTAVLFLTGMAVGQNNTATTTQKGDDNSATVTQQGSDHESLIDQFSPDYAGPNTAEVDQNSGKNNFSLINQGSEKWNVVGGEAYITQSGTNNQSRLNQGNGGNKANINQRGDNNIVGGYKGYANPANQKMNNMLDVDQIGNNNKAGIEQRHNNEATVEQVGNNNESNVAQVSPSGKTVNRAEVMISGDNNTTMTQQWGTWSRANMDITGNDNNVTIKQGKRFAWGDYNDNYASLEINGHNNSVGAGKYNADMSVTQLGDGNRVRGLTNKSWNTYTLYYEGNSAEQFTIHQEGDDNIVEGRAGNNTAAHWLDLNLSQTNDGNFIRFNTQGADNMIHINQNGMGNSAVVTQQP
jgi:hypothetical protein